MSDTWSAVVASRCVGECERPPVGAHWAQLARGNLQPSDKSSENSAEPHSRKEKEKNIFLTLEVILDVRGMAKNKQTNVGWGKQIKRLSEVPLQRN